MRAERLIGIPQEIPALLTFLPQVSSPPKQKPSYPSTPPLPLFPSLPLSPLKPPHTKCSRGSTLSFTNLTLWMVSSSATLSTNTNVWVMTLSTSPAPPRFCPPVQNTQSQLLHLPPLVHGQNISTDNFILSFLSHLMATKNKNSAIGLCGNKLCTLIKYVWRSEERTSH